MTAEQSSRCQAGGQQHIRDGTRVTADADIAAGLRRRRELAWRLPVLVDGRRDPLDALACLPGRPPQPCNGAELGAGGEWRPCCRAAS